MPLSLKPISVIKMQAYNTINKSKIFFRRDGFFLNKKLTRKIIRKKKAEIRTGPVVDTITLKPIKIRWLIIIKEKTSTSSHFERVCARDGLMGFPSELAGCFLFFR